MTTYSLHTLFDVRTDTRVPYGIETNSEAAGISTVRQTVVGTIEFTIAEDDSELLIPPLSTIESDPGLVLGVDWGGVLRDMRFNIPQIDLTLGGPFEGKADFFLYSDNAPEDPTIYGYFVSSQFPLQSTAETVSYGLLGYFMFDTPDWSSAQPGDVFADFLPTGSPLRLPELPVGEPLVIDLTNSIHYLTEDDIIDGTDGSEWINAGLGDDVVDLKAGIDTYSLVSMTERAVVDLSQGMATIGALTKTLVNVENITGSVFADRITGDSGNNVLRGLGDYDWFIGSTGDDTYDGGTGRDTVSYVNSSGGVRVNLIGTGRFNDADGDVYTSIENLTGSSFNDVLKGDAGKNIIRGLGSFDLIFGSGGNDTLDGGDGFDTVDYTEADEGMIVSLTEGRVNTGLSAGDRFISIEGLRGTTFDDLMSGNNGRNALFGNDGDDRLFGYAGVDYLEGGRGDDELNGGAGWDYAVIKYAQDNFDISTGADGVTTVTQIESGNFFGTDTLIDIEVIRFSDGDVIL